MTPEELTTKYKQKIDNELFIVDKVDKVPDEGCHPFMIGPKHVEYASDHCGGMLGEEAIAAHNCYNCHQPFKGGRHNMVTVCFLRILKKCESPQISAVIFPLKAEVTADGIDGFGFLGSENVTDWRKK